MMTSCVHRLRAILFSLACGGSLGVCPLGFAQESDLGRLLFTPQQRMVIVRERTEPVEVAGTQDGNVPLNPGMISLNGLVTRSNGAPSIWINGRLVEPGNEGGTGLLSVEGRAVRVDPRTQLKVGQAVYFGASSTVIDLVEPGSVTQGGAAVKRKDDALPGLRLKPSRSPGGGP
ncbi:MAG: hypothetical protein ACK53K_08740 [Burkholderiales bacterium]